eukprot:TRINITY_DN3573_c0_g1_i1.p1 TRINITY_DN3573_c0_g1~~TRINITY_DN3573_c0_g1_i1.p1  ORF type:complete len:561 (+),score=232.21 TRINITY_DN3573_c0_g1_i1:69-1685(+)
MSQGSIQVLGPIRDGYSAILTRDALQFLAELHRSFDPTRLHLLKERERRQLELDSGKVPTFLESTANVREGDWTGPSIPEDLKDRRVEITGPVDRKMVINALNSGAKVFMADFEDSNCPTWDSNIQGQINMRDAVNRTISFTDGKKQYRLKQSGLATLMVRPRGWHLNEDHLVIDGQPMSGSLFDFGLFFFHNAKELLKRGSGPYFYLPKMESHLEARLWNDVFIFAQERVGIPRGTIRATVLIETILAAFEMDEIIFELREHSAGLNCGRWDYIFSFIKKFRAHPDKILPDRSVVTMERPFMDAYVRLLIKTCHRRGVHAMGGMAAQIPIKDDEKANAVAMEKVVKDKLREVKAGHDGTWVAHPGLIPLAMKVFNQHMPTPNQLHIKRDDVVVASSDLLKIGEQKTITEAGLRNNIDVAIQYVEAWLRGIGCVPIHNLMEDAATAEISRVQVWQWLRHGAKFVDGKPVTAKFVKQVFQDTVATYRSKLGEEKYNKRKFDHAASLLAKMVFSKNLAEFLTTEAYPFIVTKNQKLKSKL